MCRPAPHEEEDAGFGSAEAGLLRFVGESATGQKLRQREAEEAQRAGADGLPAGESPGLSAVPRRE
jgi:hypothetical protein